MKQNKLKGPDRELNPGPRRIWTRTANHTTRPSGRGKGVLIANQDPSILPTALDCNGTDSPSLSLPMSTQLGLLDPEDDNNGMFEQGLYYVQGLKNICRSRNKLRYNYFKYHYSQHIWLVSYSSWDLWLLSTHPRSYYLDIQMRRERCRTTGKQSKARRSYYCSNKGTCRHHFITSWTRRGRR